MSAQEIEGTHLRRNIRTVLIIFIVGLVLSGITAFPLETELQIAHDVISKNTTRNDLTNWIEQVYAGVRETNQKYPFIAYGTDWLAFAHLVIAIAFIGPLRDPVRNKWVIQFGIIACLAVFPLALIQGALRGIPWFWQMIDCSFGLAGGSILLVCLSKVRKLETIAHQEQA